MIRCPSCDFVLIAVTNFADIFDEAQQYVCLCQDGGDNMGPVFTKYRESAEGFAGRNIMATVKTFVLYCISVQNSTREYEAQEKQKITQMLVNLQNYMKLINCLNFSKLVSVTVSGG